MGREFRVHFACNMLVCRVARLTLLGPNLRNVVPNITRWPKNFRLALWLLLDPFPGWICPLARSMSEHSVSCLRNHIFLLF